MHSKDLLYKIAITLIPNVGDVVAKNLISYCGGTEKVFKTKKHELIRIPGIDEVRAKSVLEFRDFNQAEAEVAFIEKNKIKTW